MRARWGMILFGLALLAMAVLAVATPGQAAQFNWRQAQGTEIRFLALRAWFTDHWKANLPRVREVDRDQGDHRGLPEDPFRQKLAVEMSAKSKSVDVFNTARCARDGSSSPPAGTAT